MTYNHFPAVPDTSGRACARATLRYAHYDGTAWLTETVNSAWRETSLKLDSAGRPHISYLSSGGLQYAYHDGAHWRIVMVDSAESVGLYPSLALDIAGNPHISYWDMANRDLKYAWGQEEVPVAVVYLPVVLKD